MAKEKNKLFNLETKEDILRMKAIYRFLHAKGTTPEQVFEEYLSDEEKAQLKKLDTSITMETLKPYIIKDMEKKKGKK